MRSVIQVLGLGFMLLQLCGCPKQELVLVVPDVVGLESTDAMSVLSEFEFSARVVDEVYNESMDTGRVLSQQPSAGSGARNGTIVKLVLSLGVDPRISVPGLTGQTPVEAENMLASVGLVLGTVHDTFSDSEGVGIVARQHPEPGQLTFPERPIAVAVSVGRNPYGGECEDCSEETIELPGGVPLTMVNIPAGTFIMGAMTAPYDEAPAHAVNITHDFQIGKYEVTKEQWSAIMPATDWGLDAEPDSPAIGVSWEDCEDFIERLNTHTGSTFRLPTEAEWEYACRAGSETDSYSIGSWSQGWCYPHTCGYIVYINEGYYPDWDCSEHIVGLLSPNRFGLFDMLGNVWEWCSDWYDASYYSISPRTDPTGPETGQERVIRGGGIVSNGECYPASRKGLAPSERYVETGLRLAR